MKGVEPFDIPTVDKAMHDYVAAKGLKLNAIQLAIRVAVTGSGNGFGISETLSFIGKDRVLKRIADLLAGP